MEFNEQMIARMKEYLNENCELILPIDELDGVRVEAKIIRPPVKDSQFYILIIGLLGIYDVGDEQLNGYKVIFNSNNNYINNHTNRKNIITSLEEMLKYTMIFLENFIVDEYCGHITTKKCSAFNLELSNLFSKFERVKLSDDECCVCKSVRTRTKTPCGHHICIRCVSKLKMAEEEEDYDQRETEVDSQRKCPMCRQTFHTLCV